MLFRSDRLFHQLCPENKTIEDILLKAATLNDFYSTNIFSIFPVAKHILELDIDTRLMNGDLTLVDDLPTVMIGGKERHFYSFASKYCSHHNEKDWGGTTHGTHVHSVLSFSLLRGSRDQTQVTGFHVTCAFMLRAVFQFLFCFRATGNRTQGLEHAG